MIRRGDFTKEVRSITLQAVKDCPHDDGEELAKRCKRQAELLIDKRVDRLRDEGKRSYPNHILRFYRRTYTAAAYQLGIEWMVFEQMQGEIMEQMKQEEEPTDGPS